jgi:hypothetical protein
MVMPCSRSAARPSTSSAKSSSPAAGADLLGVGFERRELVLEDHLRIVEQAADQRGLAVIDEPQVMKRSRLCAGARRDRPRCRVAMSRKRGPSEIALLLLLFHGAAWSWSITRPWRSEVVVSSISWMIAGRCRRRSRRRRSAGSSPACGSGLSLLRRFARAQRHALVIDHDQRAVALDDRALGREVQRHDRDVFEMDVLPDVELGPVGEREDADALALVLARVVEAPEFGRWFFGSQRCCAAEGEDALLGAGFSSSRRAPPKAASKPYCPAPASAPGSSSRRCARRAVGRTG